MSTPRLLSILSIICITAASGTQAATQYQFSANGLFGAGGTPVTGTFLYDSSVSAVNDGGIPGTFYGGAITNLQGSWNGYSFYDAGGFAGVWNDSLDDAGFGLVNVDLFQLSADAPSGGDLVGFETDFFGGITYRLSNVRIFWIEDNNIAPADFLDDELLVDVLPPTSDPLAARLSLDFVNINDPADIAYAVGFGMEVTPVPLPPALWMMLLSLSSLTVIKRRAR